MFNREGCCNREKAVRDEIRCVLADHHALAEHVFPEAHHEVEHLARGVGSRNKLKKFEIARWVEKVCSEEVLLERFRTPLGDLVDRDARGVAADNAALL